MKGAAKMVITSSLHHLHEDEEPSKEEESGPLNLVKDGLQVLCV